MPVSPNEYVSQLASRLSSKGIDVNKDNSYRIPPYKIELISNQFRVYPKSKFGSSTIYVILVSIMNVVDRKVVTTFSEETTKNILRMSSLRPKDGWVANGTVSVPVVVTYAVDEDTKKWISANAMKRHFAAVEFPVLVSLRDKQLYYYRKTPFWAGAYYNSIRKFVEETLRF